MSADSRAIVTSAANQGHRRACFGDGGDNPKIDAIPDDLCGKGINPEIPCKGTNINKPKNEAISDTSFTLATRPSEFFTCPKNGRRHNFVQQAAQGGVPTTESRFIYENRGGKYLLPPPGFEHLTPRHLNPIYEKKKPEQYKATNQVISLISLEHKNRGTSNTNKIGKAQRKVRFCLPGEPVPTTNQGTRPNTPPKQDLDGGAPPSRGIPASQGIDMYEDNDVYESYNSRFPYCTF
ncbi:hypothetical protein F4777DRAFT_598858 [Nemania sp. FL0916]|nr:hypothetical protein F4777DRAFT_598858 [Nemania sp. FL0916]